MFESGDTISIDKDGLIYFCGDDEKKVCIGFALLYLFTKYGK